MKTFLSLNLHFSADWHLWILQPVHSLRKTSSMLKRNALSQTSTIYLLTINLLNHI